MTASPLWSAAVIPHRDPAVISDWLMRTPVCAAVHRPELEAVNQEPSLSLSGTCGVTEGVAPHAEGSEWVFWCDFSEKRRNNC